MLLIIELETESLWFFRMEFFFKGLEVRNFDPMFRKWIHTFAKITSCVMNNGHASDFFQLYSGVRQGCPWLLNFEEKLVTLKNILNQWTTRNLTLIGRICIVKTLAISKLVYNTSVLKLPPNFAEKVNDICCKFIWNFRPEKVKRQAIVLPVDKGGLNMVDFTILDKSLNATWVKRFHEAGGSKWCSVSSSVTAQYGGRFIFEYNFDTRDLNLILRMPSFYRDILTVWRKLHSKNPSTAMEYKHETIWNNRFITIDGKPDFLLVVA